MNGQNGASSFATVSRQVRSVSNARRIAVPEAPPRAAHVPVRELVHQLRDRPARGRRVIGVQPLRDQLARSPRCATAPSGRGRVGSSPALGRASAAPPELRARRAARRACRRSRCDHSCLRNRRTPSPIASSEKRYPSHGCLEVKKYQRNASAPYVVEHLPRLDRVALRLRHLLAVLVEDQAEAHHVPVRRPASNGASGRAASRPPAASRTSRASGPAPRR